MTDIDTALAGLLERELTLDASKISQGSTSHNYIRNLLKNKNNEDDLFPRFIEGDFLSGSYARYTKIHPLDDIDVMMIIDGSGLQVIEHGVVQNFQVKGSERDDNPILQHFEGNRLLSSRKVINLFHEALRDSHPDSKIKKHGQAINVWLESYKLGIDIVPCFHIVPRDGSQDFYYIPEGEGSDGWIKTNPKIDERISDELHVKHNEMFRGLVRLIKYWNLKFNSGKLQSYHLETVVWHAFDNYEGELASYESGLFHFFLNASSVLSGPCADKTKLGGPVDSYLSAVERQSSLEKFNQSVQILSESYLHPQTDDAKKLAAWKRLFGDKLTF